MNKRKIIKISFLISFIYVGFATISLLGLPHDSPLYWEYSIFGVFITFPVSLLSFGIMYSEAGHYILVLMVQFVMFLLFWYLVYRYMRKRYKIN